MFIERSRDKIIAVRSAAAVGLCSLQNSQTPDTEVLTALSKNFDFEPTAQIRSIYAEHIFVHPITMESLGHRLRDEDLSVRLNLLQNLEKHSIIQQFSIQLRQSVIHCLQDRNEVIVQATENIILNNWAKHNSLFSLLSLIDVESDELVVICLFCVVLYRGNCFWTAFSCTNRSIDRSIWMEATLCLWRLFTCTVWFVSYSSKSENPKSTVSFRTSLRFVRKSGRVCFDPMPTNPPNSKSFGITFAVFSTWIFPTICAVPIFSIWSVLSFLWMSKTVPIWLSTLKTFTFFFNRCLTFSIPIFPF